MFPIRKNACRAFVGMRKYLVEFLGTFILVFTIAISGSPLIIAAVLTIIVYLGGPISAAHYNPAVTLGFILRKRITLKDAAWYALVQMIGAFAGAGLYFLISDNLYVAEPGRTVLWQAALLTELVGTFALMTVIIYVALFSKTEGNKYYGAAIGGIILVAAILGGSISGGAYNPAVGVGPIIFKMVIAGGSMQHYWLYLVGPLIGSTAAVILFRIIHPSEMKMPPSSPED